VLRWEKEGLLFRTSEHAAGAWMANSALTPTPMRLSDDIIRVYCGFRDREGVSRIGYVDVLADAPAKVVGVSRHPVLDIGRNGCFDDNGLILGDVVAATGGIYMFYVGFQLVAKAKFLAFTGLAKSTDGGETFARMSEAPILDRGPGQTTIGAVHSAMFEQGRWRIWYACGDNWQYIGGKPYPQYHIRYVETADLAAVPRAGHECLKPRGDEYRIGRPRVYRLGEKYVMCFTYGTTSGDYLPGIAYSVDGIEWVRKDEEVGISLSPSGWDSRTLCYPALVQHRDRVLMFYNGNDMGVDGFGLARSRGTLG
jgi:hypothetical protein